VKKPSLTPFQGGRVQLAQDGLMASMADDNPDHYPSHLGSLEIFLDDCLQVIAELTGEDRTPAISARYEKRAEYAGDQGEEINL
jgi:hypothetical protein